MGQTDTGGGKQAGVDVVQTNVEIVAKLEQVVINLGVLKI